MERYEVGELVMTPFPCSGEEGFKVRPALILAVLPYGIGTDYLTCLVTTQQAPDPYRLPLTRADVEGGRLTQDCFLRPTYVCTTAEFAIIRRMGRVTPVKLREVQQTLARVLTPNAKKNTHMTEVDDSAETVNITIPKAEATVLFEWVYRFCETRVLQFDHPAEAVVLDKIAAILESRLAESYQDAYPDMLTIARTDTLVRYQKQMGKYSQWLNDLPYQAIKP